MNKKAFIEAVDKALKTGQIGTPVAIRLNLQVEEQDLELQSIQSWCIEFAKSIFQTEVKSTSSRENKNHHQLSSITKYENGSVLSSTVGKALAGQSQFQFLLIGQNGIVQSDGLDQI